MPTVMCTRGSRGRDPVSAARGVSRVGLARGIRDSSSLALLLMVAAPAVAQLPPDGTGPGDTRQLPGVAASSDAPHPSAPGSAQAAGRTAAPQPPILAVGAALLLTATDNADLTTQPRHDYLVEGRLNLRLSLPYRRLRGFADYTLAAVHFGRGNESDEFLNALESELTAEVIEQYGFIDVSASIGQQMRSAFGAPTLSQGVSSETTGLSPTVANANRIESATYRVAPYLRGRLGDDGQVEARVEQTDIRFRGFEGNDFTTQRARLLADGGVRPRSLRWRAQIDGAIYDFEGGRRTHEALLRGDLGWAFNEEIVASLIGGREANNFQTAERRFGTVYGASVDWRPSERTQLYAEGLHRLFGTGHLATLSHRVSRMAIIASDSRTVIPPDRFSRGVLGSAFDVLFLQFAGVEPDPVRRRALVQDTLARNGVDSSEQVVSDFLTNSVMLVRTQSIALSWTHVRDIVTLGLARTSSRRADTLTLPPSADVFATTNRIDQTGTILTWAHRLTPGATLTLGGSLQRVTGDLSSQSTTLRSLSVLWSMQLSQATTVAFGARHDRFASDSSPYRASTATASLRTQF